MVGAFVSLFVILVVFGQRSGTSVFDIPFLILILAVTLAVVMPLTGLLNLTIERIFYRPFRHASRLAPLITAVGVSFILQNAALVIVGCGDRGHPQIFPLRVADPARAGQDLRPLDLHLPARDRADDRAQPVRDPDPPRSGDAGDRPGPAGRIPDGRRPQPDDRAHVPARRRARGGGRRRLGPALRLRPPGPRLQRRPQGVHLGGPGRDRQHQRRGPGRVHHRLRRELLDRARATRAGRRSSCSSS